MIKRTGVPTKEQIQGKFHSLEQLTKPKAIIECYQEIPCNPCSTSCPVGAITIGEDINQIPIIDFDRCTGCGMCVYSCPGLAIMVASIKEDKAYFKVPHELLPRPSVGDIWSGVNRNGDIICDAIIERVMLNKNTDYTCVITASIPKTYLYDFVTVRCPL